MQTYAIVRDQEGEPFILVGPAPDRFRIKRNLREHKRPGWSAVVVSSLRARTGTRYTVHGITTAGSGTWLRGEQVPLLPVERAMLRARAILEARGVQ